MKWFQLSYNDRPASYKVHNTEAEAEAEKEDLKGWGEMQQIVRVQWDRVTVKCVAEEPSTLYVTTAPDEYDGFGTRTVGQEGRYRIVDIVDRHANWQRGRYASGLHTCFLLTAWHESALVTDEELEAASDTWDRLINSILR